MCADVHVPTAGWKDANLRNFVTLSNCVVSSPLRSEFKFKLHNCLQLQFRVRAAAARPSCLALPMASSRNPTKLAAFMAPLPLFALLFLSGALEAVVGASNDTSADGAGYTCSSSGSRGSLASPSSHQSVFSLDRYGARGDGRHDDTRALAKAWKAACASPQPAVVLVPNGRRYLLKVVTLRGPCKSSATLTVKGTLVASPDRADWSDKDRRHWIVFRRVNKLTVNCGGTIDGNCQKWWPHSCKINKTVVSSVWRRRPTLLFI